MNQRSQVHFSILLLILPALCSAWPWDDWFSTSPRELSYFGGKIASTDILCAKKIVGKGTLLPVNVFHTSPLTIKAYSLQAVVYSKKGFTAGINGGALDSKTLNLFIDAPNKKLPYAVAIDYYCAAPAG